ncbi:MAG TPA: hypothetical protein DEB19_03050 [Synechococcales bacterium UBA8138]|nr:hypothetical protein [Synechococcales bacterium UBA8138]
MNNCKAICLTDAALRRRTLSSRWRRRHPQRHPRTSGCRQPEVVWINPPADDFIAHTAKLKLAA